MQELMSHTMQKNVIWRFRCAIRIGLQNGVDVSVYENPAYDWFQMEEIRPGLEQGIDISRYANEQLTYDKMRQIRKGLAEGVDLSGFYQLDAALLRELRKALVSDVDMMTYIKQGYAAEQLSQIRHALEKKLDIGPYLIKEFRGASIQEIAKGLEEGVDVSCYARIEYGWRQMREIRPGLEHRIDITKYANPLYDWRQMCEIRLGLEEGLDVRRYRSLMYPDTDMQRMRLQLLEQVQQGSESAHKSLADGLFSLTVSEDEMEACLQMNGKPEREVPVGEVVAFLRQAGIVSGVLESEIAYLLERKVYYQPVTVAKGEPAKKGKDGWYEFFFRTELNRAPKILSDGSVDYQNIEWFEVVTKGQKLAYYHAAEAGTDGCTVTGKVCVARRGKEANILRGRGFQLLEDKKTYVAARDGKITLWDDLMTIDSLCVLDEVTTVTGNVDFDGCVYIRGNVGSNAKIRATKDIVIDGTAEDASLESGGSILLKKGINGGKTGSVEAGKDVVGGFFESVRVHAGGDIQANYCLNCELCADGEVLMIGKKGTLTGGSTYAGKGIRAYQIGNETGLATKLTLGVNEEVLRTKRSLEKEQEDNRHEIRILRNAYLDFEKKYPPEQRNTMEMYLKLENAIYTKEKQAGELARTAVKLDAEMAAMKRVQAVIKGPVYDGTQIEIDGMKWHAGTEVRNVTVRKAQDRIAVYAN